MRPILDINIGDVYRNIYGQMEYVVVDINISEKMVLITPLNPVPGIEPFWKSNKSKIFTRRILKA